MENNLQKQGHDEQNQAQIQSGQTQSFFLVDDLAAVLNGTAMSLKQEFPNADIATAMTAQEARQKLKTLQPDVVIVDFLRSRVVDQSALQAIEDLAAKYEAKGKTLKLRHLSKDCHGLLTKAGQLMIDSVDDPDYELAVDYNVRTGIFGGGH